MNYTCCAPTLIPTSALGPRDRGASFTPRDLPLSQGDSGSRGERRPGPHSGQGLRGQGPPAAVRGRVAEKLTFGQGLEG